MPGRPANLDNIRQGPSALAVGTDWGLFGHFFSLVIHYSGRWPDISLNTVKKGSLNLQ